MNRKPQDGNVRNVQHIAGNVIWTVVVFGGYVFCESTNERKFILRISRKGKIVKVISQPTSIEYVNREGKKRSYTPDFMVYFADGSIAIYEITIAARRSSPAAQDRERAGAEAAEAHGWSYYILTEDDLPAETELANLMALYPFRARVFKHSKVEAWVKANLLPDNPLQLKYLLPVIAKETSLAEERVFKALAHLIWHGGVEVDLKKRLLFVDAEPDMSSLIWLSGEEAA